MKAKQNTYLAILLIGTVLLLSISSLYAQEEQDDKPLLTLSAYVDGYYAAYNNDMGIRALQPLITVGARDNAIGLNIAQIGLNYQSSRIRSNLILHHGDIAKATWNSDFNNVQEANVGMRLSKKVWLDVGFFATHIGTESFLPKNNVLSSTAFKTYNEPFYQSGAKLTHEGSDEWEFQFWILNGYNSFIDNNSAKSIGVLFTYDLSDNSTLTYTNLYGRESPDVSRWGGPEQIRFYQNIYLNQNFNEKILMTLGFDNAWQSNSDIDDPDKAAIMYAGVAILRYQFKPQSSLTGRYETFQDPNGFIGGLNRISGDEDEGYKLNAFTIGGEYRPTEKSYLRAEFRQTVAQEDLMMFFRNNQTSNTRFEFLLTMGVEIEKILK